MRVTDFIVAEHGGSVRCILSHPEGYRQYARGGEHMISSQIPLGPKTMAAPSQGWLTSSSPTGNLGNFPG